MEFSGDYAVAFVSKQDIDIDGKLILNGNKGDSKITPGGGLKGAPGQLGGGGGGEGGRVPGGLGRRERHALAAVFHGAYIVGSRPRDPEPPSIA